MPPLHTPTTPDATPRPQPSTTPREPPAVRLAREYLEAHCASVVRLSTLAALTGLSAFHLVHVFRAAVGVPPYAYLVQCRARRAAALLREGHGVSAAACLAGFSDQSHLTRVFKRVLGVTPGRYARAHRRAA